MNWHKAPSIGEGTRSRIRVRAADASLEIATLSTNQYMLPLPTTAQDEAQTNQVRAADSNCGGEALVANHADANHQQSILIRHEAANVRATVATSAAAVFEATTAPPTHIHALAQNAPQQSFAATAVSATASSHALNQNCSIAAMKKCGAARQTAATQTGHAFRTNSSRFPSLRRPSTHLSDGGSRRHCRCKVLSQTYIWKFSNS